MIVHPWLKLRITIVNRTLHFLISNSQPLKTEPQLKKGNIGLKNVKQRLQLLYPGTHELNIVSKSESFTVNLKIGLQDTITPTAINEELKTTTDYAMA